jgi:hypothetical protein
MSDGLAARWWPLLHQDVPRFPESADDDDWPQMPGLVDETN